MTTLWGFNRKKLYVLSWNICMFYRQHLPSSALPLANSHSFNPNPGPSPGRPREAAGPQAPEHAGPAGEPPSRVPVSPPRDCEPHRGRAMLWHAPLHPGAGSGYVGERFFLSRAPSPALGRLGGGTGEVSLALWASVPYL